ncbi:MAG: hypothetical protein ABFD89_03675 [Bryobacteraceae bacterium]
MTREEIETEIHKLKAATERLEREIGIPVRMLEQMPRGVNYYPQRIQWLGNVTSEDGAYVKQI